MASNYSMYFAILIPFYTRMHISFYANQNLILSKQINSYMSKIYEY